ncbi:hypothetical protein Rhopal_007868-T1 [Rhodotorula paludigena]|uniref:Alpha/beta hydrolase fold-3 domain-containing protein n=1 Tax=Rhodotorula paludigena TaxID=86838 RepID=A0AAV5GQU6_9BASI|nr:hypothetical protein Rhopal_007868-T1 [Rhodotorula paludigena]
MAEQDSQPDSLATRLAGTSGLLYAAIKGTFGHLLLGAAAPTWPVQLSALTAVIRHRQSKAIRARLGKPAPPEDEIMRLSTEQREAVERLLATEGDKLKEGVVKEIEFRVTKRGLGGVLEELDGEETGDRVLKAEWLAHDSLLTGERSARDNLVLLSLHGGAHVRLSTKTHRPLHVLLSKETRCRVFALDYRLSPQVRFPSSLLDAVSAYFYLTEECKIPASQIIVEGDSAGGNLAVALMMYLRDSNLPQVGGAVLLSPWLDLSTSFESWELNKKTDYLSIDNPNDPLHPPRLFLTTPSQPPSHYTSLLAHPYVSPALAPLSTLSSLPPLLVHSGGLETLADEITVFVRRARRAGSERITHQIWTDGPHVFQALLRPAGEHAAAQAGAWIEQQELSSGCRSERAGWAEHVDELLRAERSARMERCGPIPSKDPLPPTWTYERTVERVGQVLVKPGAVDAAVSAALEAGEVEGSDAEVEVFRPVRAAAKSWWRWW